MAPQQDNYQTIQRVAVLETEMKNVRTGIEELKKDTKEQTKHIYYGLGALGALILVAQLAMSYVKK